MKTTAIIQARMGSERLPGKVLMPICGKAMIHRVVERVRDAVRLDEIVIATANTQADKPLVDYCQSNQWNVFAGDENDVLSRYYGAANRFGAETIVRITADCPLIEPKIIDEAIQVFQENEQYDCVCNFWPQRKFPRGLDVEVFSRNTLGELHEKCNLPSFREHVTLAIYQMQEKFNIGSVINRQDHSYLRWTVDTKADLELTEKIYEHFGSKKFDWQDVINAYHLFPEWICINQHVVQKAA